MSKTRDSHRQALRQLIDKYGLEGEDWYPLVEEILRINDRFSRNPGLDEALNSGDGTYKP